SPIVLSCTHLFAIEPQFKIEVGTRIRWGKQSAERPHISIVDSYCHEAINDAEMLFFCNDALTIHPEHVVSLWRQGLLLGWARLGCLPRRGLKLGGERYGDSDRNSSYKLKCGAARPGIRHDGLARSGVVTGMEFRSRTGPETSSQPTCPFQQLHSYS